MRNTDRKTDFRAIGGALRLILALVLLLGASYGADWLLRAENFPVRNLYFEGPFKRVTHGDLERAVLDSVQGNFFLVDLNVVRARLETVPWVHRVSVRRRFPQHIHIEFGEQQLVARWGADAFVNTSGEVVRLAGEGLPTELPRLEGPEGTAAQVYAAYEEFRAALSGSETYMTSLRLTPRRSWEIELAAGPGTAPLMLVLHHDRPRTRLERFARVYGGTLARQAGAIKQVDLRYTNGFAVEWRNGHGAGARVAGAEMPGNEG